MRYAVFSDVHANLEATTAVLEVFRKYHFDQYVFAGDIVGYGADPGECLALLRQLDPLCVAGNHDWAAVELTDIDYFSENAAKAVVWTKEHICEADRLFLSGLSLVKEENGFCLVHGTLSHPEDFDYMSDGYQATKTFALLKQQVCFVGHSHQRGVFIEEQDRLVYQVPVQLALEPDKRYIINVGSVGQPRNGDPRACFCIYDDQAQTIEFKLVDYDIPLAQKKIIDAGLPKSLADRLSIGR